MRRMKEVLALIPASHASPGSQLRLRAARRGGRGFGSCEAGIVSVIAAGVLVLVIAIAAVVVDAGSMLLARRTLQAATDAAALAAAQNLENAQPAATDALAQNGFDAGNLGLAELGRYDSSQAAGQRFTPTNDPAMINAVRVSTQATARMYFSRALGLSNFANITARATATISPTVAFGAGTQLANLDAGAINSILGSLLGSSVSLSLADYQALARAQVDALSFLDALATKVGLGTGSSYGDLLNANASIGQVLDAAAEALQSGSDGSSDTSVALSGINMIAGRVPSGTSMRIGDVVDAGYFSGKAIGQGSSTARLSMLDIIESSIGSASTGKTIGLGLGIPNVTSAKLAIGTPMRFTIGEAGTTIHTAQIRIAIVLNATIAIPLVLPATGISVPIYIEGAEGTAIASAIPCQPNDLAHIASTAGAATARFATVSNQALVDFSSPPAPGAAQVSLAGFSLITISGSTTAAGAGPTELKFASIGETQRVSGTDPGASLLTDLRSSLSVTPSIPLVTPLINTTVSTLVQTLGTVLLPTLQALGVRLGNMDVTLSGVKCTPMLVE